MKSIIEIDYDIYKKIIRNFFMEAFYERWILIFFRLTIYDRKEKYWIIQWELIYTCLFYTKLSYKSGYIS